MTMFTRKGSAEYGGEAGKILVGWFTWFSDRLVWEPFNFKKAPQELSSVRGKSQYAAVQRKLEGELARLSKHDKVPNVPDTAFLVSQNLAEKQLLLAKLLRDNVTGTSGRNW
jgi:hypothetical protein